MEDEFFYVPWEWQFHPTKVDRDDVVPTLYHSLCKWLSLGCLVVANVGVVLIAYVLFYRLQEDGLKKKTQRRAKEIRALPKK